MTDQENNVEKVLEALRQHEAREEPQLARLNESIERVGVEQERHIRSNERQHNEIQVSLDTMQEDLYGGRGVTGMEQRLATLEKMAVNINGWGKWLKVGVAGVILNAVWELIQKGGTP